jgi:hypothetical protein
MAQAQQTEPLWMTIPVVLVNEWQTLEMLKLTREQVGRHYDLGRVIVCASRPIDHAGYERTPAGDDWHEGVAWQHDFYRGHFLVAAEPQLMHRLDGTLAQHWLNSDARRVELISNHTIVQRIMRALQDEGFDCATAAEYDACLSDLGTSTAKLAQMYELPYDEGHAS